MQLVFLCTNQRVCWALPGYALPVLGLEILLSRNLQVFVGLISFVFLSLRNHCPSLPDFQRLENYRSDVFFCFVGGGGGGSSGLCVVSGRRVRVVPIFLFFFFFGSERLLNAVQCSLVRLSASCTLSLPSTGIWVGIQVLLESEDRCVCTLLCMPPGVFVEVSSALET